MKKRILAIGLWLFSAIVAFVAFAQTQSPLVLPELNTPLEQYERRIVAKANADQRPAIALFRQVRDAMAQGKPALAIEALEILAGKNRGQGEAGAQTWLRLALAWQAQSVSSPRGDPPGPAIAAAYGAYQRAQVDADRIEALSLLGNMLMRLTRTDTIPDDPPDNPRIIQNTELARRLAFQVFSKLAEIAPGKYDSQRRSAEAPPFELESVTYPPPPRPAAKNENRCSEYTRNVPGSVGQPGNDDELPQYRVRCVDNNTESTCLVFSRNFGVEPSVAAAAITVQHDNKRTGQIDTLNIPPVAVRQNTICYARLAYGSSYRFTVKDTLRGIDNTPLTGPKTAKVDLPPRQPSLGFRRGAYVLQANGPHRIALKTVNLTRAQLMLRRIGDRNLVREIVAKHIVGTAAPQDSCLLLSEVSEAIADATLDMSPSTVEDREYRLPVGEILAKRREWLQSANRGSETKIPLADENRNTLTVIPRGDDVAAATGASAQAGVFILFGKPAGITRKPSPDDLPPDEEDKAKQCAEGMSSQWFVITDIGLTLQRSHSKIYVIARELDTGAPVQGATIEFLSKSGTRLETQTTNKDGYIEISGRLGRGAGGNALAAVVAYRESNKDFAFLDMTTDAIDLSDRGLDGASKVGDYDAFIAPSRAIFRPGETLEALILVRGPNGQALQNLPPIELAMSMNGIPLKKQVFNTTNTDFTRGGGFQVKAQIPKSAAEGTLTVTASALGAQIGSTTVAVQYYKPLTVRISHKDGAIAANINERSQLLVKGTARADYLYGMASGVPGSASTGTDAPAAKLRGEMQVRLEPTTSPLPKCFDGFTFGLHAEEARTQLFRGPSLQTDETGQINIDFPQDGVLPSQVPMRAALTMTLLDLNGRAAEGKFEIPVTRAGRRWIGVRAVPATRPDAPTKFEFVMLDDKNQSVRDPIWVMMYREQTDFVWSQDATSWVYTPVYPQRDPVGQRLSPAVTRPSGPDQGECPAVSTFEMNFPDPGRYVLLVTDEGGGTPTELTVGSGWTTAPDGNIKPDALRVWTQEQRSFARGEEVRVDIETPHDAGEVFVEVVINGEVRHTFEAPISREANMKAGRARGSFRIANDWPSGAMHIYATSFRKAGSDDSEKGGPNRAIGGLATQIGASAQRPTLRVNLPIESLFTWELREPIRIPIATTGLSQNAWVAVAVVNQGILDLTPDFKTPDPYEHFFKRRGINLDVFDNYGRVLHGRYGADQVVAPFRGAGYQPDDIVVWHSGIERMTNGQAVVVISPEDLKAHIPETFQGRLRFMAWAWDDTTAAAGDRELPVRDPVVVQLSRPVFMAPGDTSLLPLRVHNPGNAAIDSVSVDVNLTEGLTFADDVRGATPTEQCGGGGSPTCRRLNLPARADAPATIAQIPVHAGDDANGMLGRAELSYRLGDRQMSKTWRVPVRSPYPHVVELLPQGEIARGGTRQIQREDLIQISRSKYDVNSLRLAARVSRNDLLAPPVASVVPETEIVQLEQLTSLLQLVLLSDAPDQTAIVERVNRLVGEIGALQKAEGDFRNAAIPAADSSGKAPNETNDANPATVAFVLDVFSRAKATGADVDDAVIDKAVSYLSGVMRSIGVSDKCTRSDVYVLNVLARLNRIGPASFRSVSDTCVRTAGDDATKRLLLAAAYGSFGFTEQAQAQLASARIANLNVLAESPAEATRVGALLLESGQAEPNVVLTKVGLTTPDRTENLVTSSWLARVFNAALQILDKRQSPFAPDSVTVTPSDLVARINREGLELRPVEFVNFPREGIRIANRGDAPLQLSYVLEGVPLKVQAENFVGLKARRERLGAEPGKELEFKQFQAAYFSVEINQTDGYAGAQRLAAVQLLPSGFEGVETTYQETWQTFVGGAVNKRVVSDQEYAEFQTDRWIALPRATERRATYLLALSIRPTFPGEYVLPPLLIRDLDNPQRIAWTKPLKVVVTPAE